MSCFLIVTFFAEVLPAFLTLIAVLVVAMARAYSTWRATFMACQTPRRSRPSRARGVATVIGLTVADP